MSFVSKNFEFETCEKFVINIDRMKFKTAYQYSMIVYIVEKVNQEFSITSMSIFTVIELIISSVVEFPIKHDFWPRINILEGKKITKLADECQFAKN